MKKVKYLVCAIALLLVGLFVFVACDYGKNNTVETETVKPEITSVESGKIEGDTISIETGTTVDLLDLAAVITVSNGSTFSVAEDEDGRLAIPDKKIKLSNGDNEFFITVKNADESKLYTLKIWKNFYATVEYYYNDTLVDRQSVLSHTYLEEHSEPYEIEDVKFIKWNSQDYYVDKPYVRFDAIIKKTLNVYVNGKEQIDNKVKLECKYNVDMLNMAEVFRVSAWADWNVYQDEKCTQVIGRDLVPLKNGENIFYVMVDPQGKRKKYTFNVWKDYYVTASYYIEDELFDVQPVLFHSYLEDFRAPTNLEYGIRFVSWNCEGYYVDSESLRFDAELAYEQCNLTLDPRGGICASQSVQVERGKGFQLPVPTKEGYEFDGWCLDNIKVTFADGRAMRKWDVAGDSELTASWTPKFYRYTFTPDVEKLCEIRTVPNEYLDANKVEYMFGGEYTVAIVNKKNDGYRFLGWFIDGKKMCEDTVYTFTVDKAEDVQVNLMFEFIEELNAFEYETLSFNGRITIHGVKDKTVDELVVPDCVGSISMGAFAGLGNLKALTVPFVPDSLGELFGWREFYGSEEVKTGEYGTGRFLPSSLESVTVNRGEIKNGAFRNLTMLKSVTLGKDVTSIGDEAFMGCTQLSDITFGNDTIHIGANAFDNTAWFDNQKNGVVYIGKVVYKYKGTESNQDDSITVTLKADTVGIAGRAFENCDSYGVVSVIVYKEVADVGREVFYGCTQLEILCEASHVPDGWNMEWLKGSDRDGVVIHWNFESTT